MLTLATHHCSSRMWLPPENSHIGLASLTLLYHRLLTQLQHLQTADGKFRVNKDVGDDAVRQILAIIKYATDLQDNSPPLPDEKLNRGESIREYLLDLQQRQPEPADITDVSK
jgi:hypothetical protein